MDFDRRVLKLPHSGDQHVDVGVYPTIDKRSPPSESRVQIMIVVYAYRDTHTFFKLQKLGNVLVGHGWKSCCCGYTCNCMIQQKV